MLVCLGFASTSQSVKDRSWEERVSGVAICPPIRRNLVGIMTLNANSHDGAVQHESYKPEGSARMPGSKLSSAIYQGVWPGTSVLASLSLFSHLQGDTGACLTELWGLDGSMLVEPLLCAQEVQHSVRFPCLV